MVTMQQVADRANVSIATVSFVVNGTKPVSAKTRERILKAIDELGYRRNAAARALASRRSHILALLFPLMDRHIDRFVEAAARVATARGYKLVLWPIDNNAAAEEVMGLIGGGFADGVLLMEVQLEDERVTQLKAADAPFVLIGRTRDLDGIDYVDIDFERTVELAVDELISRGHRHIALLLEDFDGTPLAGYSPPVRAEQTFLQTMRDRGLTGSVFRCRRSPAAGRRAADEILETAPEATAIILMNDDAGFGLVNGLRHHGVRVPDDMSILSVATSSTMGALIDPALSTLDAPGGRLGELAAEALIDRLEGRGDDPTQVLLACELHEAGSLAAPRATGPLSGS